MLGQWDEAGYATQQFAENFVFHPLPDDNYPYVQYDRYFVILLFLCNIHSLFLFSWGYGLGINETNQLAGKIPLCL